MEWHALTIRRSIPSRWRSPTFNPLASTTRRAEISSPFDSHDLLPLGAGRNGRGLGVDRFDRIGDFGPDRVDQRVVHDAVLPARPLVEQVAEARNPVLAVMSRGAKHGFRDAGPAKTFELQIAAEFFDAKIGRIERMRVDQDSGNTGAPEHGRSGRAGKAAADDGNVGVLHGPARFSSPMIAPGKANKALASRPAFDSIRAEKAIQSRYLPGYY